jgi:tripeptidyl-peptidase-1
MRLTLTTLALLLAAGASAAPSPAMLVKESVAAPRGWVRRGDVPAGTTIPLSFALKQRGAAELEAALLAVSDPASARYGQHLTRDDVAALLAPAPEAQQAVRRWMASHGIEEDVEARSYAGDWIRARVPVEKARDMLDADFAVWARDGDERQIVRALQYSLPRELHE